ncbi:hypothetical protein E2C01_094434 [Portunus trituberculatus]|uniref:Uncharacterized protein n=1 Tax=Portunus trituberculatus TaxID=210409 RepID=A0A5B7JQE9_PORTR|nr:hypothetical protein [Portunus trituberculatus]
MANGDRNLENGRDHYFLYPSLDMHPCSDRLLQTLLARLRIGHTYLTQRYLLTKDRQPYCDDCLVPLTVRHLLGNGAVEYHSVSNLYPLEVSMTHGGREGNRSGSDGGADEPPVHDIDSQVNPRPRRHAAIKFNKMLRDKLPYL